MEEETVEDEEETVEITAEEPSEEETETEVTEEPAEEVEEVEETSEEEEPSEKKVDTFNREMHKAVCADCGKECEVPFKPVSGRPVYCRDCYRKHMPQRRRY
jgi:CxxC-x17-CxxC domain-containing protein